MSTEIRLAFALNGGVSLAIWISGVADEVLRCINGGRDAAGGTPSTNLYADICAELDVTPKADVLTGTSAGGLNAVFIATAVSHGCTNLRPIRSLWLEHGAIDRMMRAATDQSFASLLAGDSNFLPHIENALKELLEAGTGFREPDPPVVVRLTGTSLPGQSSTIRDGQGEVSSVDHRAEFIFHTRDFDFEADPGSISRMARACRSSASFPGAFEPSTVESAQFESWHTSGLFDDDEVVRTPVIDGGLLVNLPAQAALDAIIRQPSRERVERVLALVVPDPGATAGGARIENPTLGHVLSKALVGIPMTQSLSDFVKAFENHNREVRIRRSARNALFAEFAELEGAEAWQRMSALGEALLPSYRSMRLAATLDRTRLSKSRALQNALEAAGLGDLPEIGAGHVPWVPERLAVGDDTWCWGSSAVRRLAALLITWVNTVAEAADPDTARELLALKADAGAVRTRVDQISPSAGVVADLLAEELAADPSSVEAAFDRACRRWPSSDAPPVESIRELNAAFGKLAECTRRFVDLAREPVTQWADDQDGRALKGLVRLVDGAAQESDGQTDGLSRLLMCLEVVEATFAGADLRPDQEVQLIQFTSSGPVDIDTLARSDPREKLAGIELAHFGAFLKGSWRANDWMWGRLDAAQRLLRLLDASAGHRLSTAGTLEKHTRAVQAAVLREELPAVVAEIERDGRLGAWVTPEARAFVDAVRLVGATAPDGQVDLSQAHEVQLQELLRLQLVGSEDISMEAGSNLATVTSIGALSIGVQVLREQGPRVLRGPIGLLGTSASFASRMTKRGWGVNLHTALLVVIAGTGLVGLVGSFLSLLTDVSLGWFSYVAMGCLLLTPVIALFAAPWLVLGVGRRKVRR